MSLTLAWPADAPATFAPPLLVGFSGGLDSTVLLHRLAGDATLRARGLRAIHVHHGMHADADAWAVHCGRICAALGVPLDVARVQVARDGGEGLEAAARRARHAAFERTLAADEALVLAHHRDDQAETFLLRALRASGVDGLGAMRCRRRFGRGWLWRPLLDTPRQALHDYARAHRLHWIDDPANADDAHDRNFLRHQVLPLLRERWPQADAAFARSAALLREASTLLADGDAEALAAVRSVDPRCLRADALRAMDDERRARVLRRWIEEAGLPPLPAEGVAHIVRGLLDEGCGKAPAFAWRGAAVRRWRGLLWAGAQSPPFAGLPVTWDGLAPLPLAGGGALRFDPPPPAITATRRGPDAASGTPGPSPPFTVHARRGGERITLPGRQHSHALKHVLQDLGVPPWVRARLPLLSDADGTLLAAGDLVLSAGFDAWLRAGGRRFAWSGVDAA